MEIRSDEIEDTRGWEEIVGKMGESSVIFSCKCCYLFDRYVLIWYEGAKGKYFIGFYFNLVTLVYEIYWYCISYIEFE